MEVSLFLDKFIEVRLDSSGISFNKYLNPLSEMLLLSKSKISKFYENLIN